MSKLSKSLDKIFEQIKSKRNVLDKTIDVPDFTEKNPKIRKEQYKQYTNSIPKTLYHSTLIDSMHRANKNSGWIDPSRGAVVSAVYGGEETKPAKGVFMTDEENGHGYYSLEQLRHKLKRQPTKQEFLSNAAVAHIDPNDKGHSGISYRHEKDNIDGTKFIKPWANALEDKRITHGEWTKPEKFMHVEPNDYFSSEGVKPFKWLHGKELHEDILQNPHRYHKDVLNLVNQEDQISKTLKKSSDRLNFPSGKEYEQILSQPAEETGSKSLEDFKKLQDNERKYQYMTGEAQHEEKPIRILDTRMLGSPNRLRALIEHEDGKRNIVQIHRLKNIKLSGISNE